MTRKAKAAETIEQRVANAAVEAARVLAGAWPERPFAVVRGAVVYALFAEMAHARGMVVQPLGVVWPDLPVDALERVRGVLGALPLGELTTEQFGCAHEALSGYARVDGGCVAPSDGRRKGGVHFTPRSMTEPIVATTLRPLLALVAPEATLTLRVCDPAVGAGAFLLEVVRQLGARALDAGLARGLDEAKRLAAIHCAYGVDVCRVAVFTAKLALTLECAASEMPIDWLDDNIKCGDALVGCSREQMAAFHLQPKPVGSLREWAERAPRRRVVDEAMRQGVDARVGRMAELARQARA